MAQGTVKWFSGYKSLEENQRVEFEIGRGQKGLQAQNVRPT
ncbi:cold-shock protein [Rhodococcus koreensis]